MKKTLCLLTALILTGLLCGCAMLDKEYVSIHDYVPTAQEPGATGGRVVVYNAAGIKSALLAMAYDGRTDGCIVFDSAYEGEATADLENACWTVRTEDALCACCVENITYDFNKIITINEADIRISYSKASESPDKIVHLGFSSEANPAILNALQKGRTRLTLLVGHSGYSAEEMAAQVAKVYRDNPGVTPQSPVASVSVFSGAGSQRLYEIQLDYGMSAARLAQCRRQMQSFNPFPGLVVSGMSEAERAYVACRWLIENCAISDEGANSAYAALIERSANSEGVAFGFVELCRLLSVDCQIIYGQLDWAEHCWNIVRLDDSYYHVDVTQCARGGLVGSFMKNDEAFWGAYRWDVGNYPKCTGTSSFFNLFMPVSGEEPAPEPAQ